MRAYAIMALAVAVALNSAPAPSADAGEGAARIAAVVFWPVAAFAAAHYILDRHRIERENDQT